MMDEVLRLIEERATFGIAISYRGDLAESNAQAHLLNDLKGDALALVAEVRRLRDGIRAFLKWENSRGHMADEWMTERLALLAWPGGRTSEG